MIMCSSTPSLIVIIYLFIASAAFNTHAFSATSSSQISKNFNLEDENPIFRLFPCGPPYLALITKRNSCDNEDQFQKSCHALQQALATQQVDLVTVRITPSTADPKLTLQLIQYLVELNHCPVVVHQDWIPEAIQAQAHGIHVKEGCQDEIPLIRRQFQQASRPQPWIGMTVHSLESAQTLYPHQPDYMFVGSCFVSDDSHPEKQNVEGTELPGRIAMDVTTCPCPCPVLAIGGIEIDNCHIPVEKGAHGVTAIKSVLQSSNPANSVLQLCSQMQSVCAGGSGAQP